MLYLPSQIQTDITDIVDLIREMMAQAPNIIPPFDPAKLNDIASDIMQSIDWSQAEIYLSMSGMPCDLTAGFCYAERETCTVHFKI